MEAPLRSVHAGFDAAFLALEGFVVLFLLFHDWIPLGNWNNLGAIHSEDPLSRRVFVTLLPAIPTGLGLYWSAVHLGRPYPGDLLWFLWITYGVLLFGILRAWWIPYLLIRDAKRAERYRILFHGTRRFLPERNGLAPDALHCSLHLGVLAILAMLLIRTIG